jgi:DNA-binding transcriptional LysR family regulator
MIDPRRLLTFREVAHRASFSRAAEALALTQPAVSQQVAALERAVGAPLLVRGPGGPVPTDAGGLLLEHADAIAERLALASTQLDEVAGAERRRLRLGAFPSALATVVPGAVAALRATEPALEADVSESSNEGLLAGVRGGDLHAAVVFEDTTRPRRDLGGLRREDLFAEPLVAGVPAAHRLARRRRVALADLAAEPWTAPSRDGLIARACRAAGFEPDIAYVASDPLAIGGLVAAGLAVTLTPQLLAGLLPGVVTIPADGAPRRAVYVVSPPRGRHPLVAPLVAALADAARARRAA